MSGTGEDQILEKEMLLAPHHSGTTKDIRSSVLGMGEDDARDQISKHLLCYKNLLLTSHKYSLTT